MHGSWFKPWHLLSSLHGFYLLLHEYFVTSVVTHSRVAFTFFISSLDHFDKRVPLISKACLQLPSVYVTFTSSSECYKPSMSTAPGTRIPLSFQQAAVY